MPRTGAGKVLSKILTSLEQNLDYTEKEKLLILENQELTCKITELADYITRLTDSIQKESDIRDLIGTIGESLDLDETLANVIEKIAALTKADRCIIYLTDPKEVKTYLYKEFRIQEKVKSARKDLELTFLFDDYLKSIRKSGSVLIENIDSSSLNKVQRQYFDYYNIKSIIMTPITYNEELLGLILVHQSDLLCDWNSSHSEALIKISNQAAISIKNAILYARLTKETELKNNVLNNIPIELKNHINSLIGFSELLLQQQQDKLMDRQKQYLANIVASARLLNKAINDINFNT
ncbi:MAG: GAF domain-containing protein [Candidatus Gastranaerophilaceae bacterium]